MRWKRRQVEPGASASSTIADWQRGQCATCGRANRTDGMELDHSHRTGLIRGYLCRNCNRYEGHPSFGAYADGMNPAVLLGIAAVYLNPWGGMPVLRADTREIATAAFRLAGLDFDQLPRVVGLASQPAELAQARALLWAAEGWPPQQT